ncbi:MAG: DNA translocase FtsK 4TM domain-containing protein [Granulosicoccaceae bacterium]
MAQATKKRASAATRKKVASKKKSSSRVSRGKATSSRKTAVSKREATRAAAASALSDGAALGHLGRVAREVGGIVCVFASILALLALATFDVADPGWSHTGQGVAIVNSVGRAGAWFADVTLYLFGFMGFLVPLVLAVSGWLLFRGRKTQPKGYRPFAFIRVIGLVLMLMTASGLADLHFGVPEGALPQGTFGGGILGTATAWRLVSFLNPLGTTLMLLALFFCSLTMAFGTSWIQLIENLGAVVLRIGEKFGAGFGKAQDVRAERAKVAAADRVRQERLRPAKASAPIGDPLMDSFSTDGPAKKSGGLAAAFAAAREKARAGGAAARNAARNLSDPAPTIGKGERFDEMAASLEEADALLALERGDTLEVPANDIAPVKAAMKRAAAALSAIEPEDSALAPPPAAPRKKKIAIKQRAPEQKQTRLFLDVPDSELPPLSLLDAPAPQRPGFSDTELEGLSRMLEEKLAEFRIAVEVVAVHPGPVITRFEMQPAPGIKASRITGLSQDIARSLSIVSVRVVEVIPGKSTIGIEIPNEHREIVQLSEMLQSGEYIEKPSPLTIALGKNISGQPVTADLGRMPHLLVAGTTGSGKSVAVNAMLISLLYKATPNELRLILIDPKMLELNMYDGIPHLLTPVVTDMKEAANALRWCVGEMERRYTIMAELKVRNIAGYNKKVTDAIKAGTPIVDPLYQAELALEPTAAPPTLEPMPFIVVVVDEFADMMMQVGKKAEEMIARIAQKARAAGIHLILATQRPSVDVITGLIKANIPTRIAFQVSQKVDSRTILDQGGAESLLGHGDMLYLPPGTALPIRVHGAFVDDHEVYNVVGHIKASGEPNYIDEILEANTVSIPGLAPADGESGGEQDALYDQAVAIVLESRKASISYVQRRLKIGYNRAARMVEEMEAAGVVSTVTSSGTREVLAPPPL